MDVTPVNNPGFARYFSVAQPDVYLPGSLPLPEPFPAELPLHPRLQFGRSWRRANHGGADYHDIINLGGNRFAIALADVSGPAAASAATMIRTVLRGRAGRHEDAGSLLHYMSEHFHYLWNDTVFATGMCAVVDPRRRTVRLACAAHSAPLLARQGAPVMPLLVHNTMPLGNSSLIVTTEYELRAGDRLLFYTDGVIARESAGGSRYGVDRLRTALETTRELPATLAVDCLEKDIEGFATGHEADDEQTLLMVAIN